MRKYCTTGLQFFLSGARGLEASGSADTPCRNSSNHWGEQQLGRVWIVEKVMEQSEDKYALKLVSGNRAERARHHVETWCDCELRSSKQHLQVLCCRSPLTTSERGIPAGCEMQVSKSGGW